MASLSKLCGITTIAALALSQVASAQVTIIRNFTGGTAHASSVGGGDLQTIFNDACDWWEATLVTPPYTLTINYSWANLGGTTLGVHNLLTQGGIPNRETSGQIRFDNDGSSVWFMDPTPCDNSEYASGELLSSASFGAGTMNTGRRHNSATGSASGRMDLLTVCLHEIGHALGLSSANSSFVAGNADLDVDITAPLPFAGSQIPTISGAHLNVTNSLMFPSVSNGLRRLITEADALANAQISTMTGINVTAGCPGTGGGGSPLTTTFANNNGGSVGGAVYFALEGVAGGGGATITDIDLNCAGAGGATGSIEVYIQDGCTFDHLGVWGGPVATSASTTTNASGTPTNFVLNTPLSIGEGCCLSIAIVANGFGHAYTTGTSPFPLTYATTHLSFTGGSASNAPFSGSAFNPRVANASFHYTVGGSCPDLASAESVGEGCVADFTSFYEELTTAAFDLTNSDFNGTNSAAGYTVSSTVGSGIIAPGAIGTPTVLTMPDDGQVVAGTLGLVVGSNGWVALGGGNANAWAPNVATFLDNPSTGLYAWTDLQPNNSGTVSYEEDPATGRTRTTFDQVNGWNTMDPHSIQFDFNVNTGDWNLRIGVVGFNNPEDWLVGFSPAGPSADPGSRDLTLASLFSFNTQTADTVPLTLEAVGTPIIGQPFQLTTTNIEPTAIFHVGIVGLTQVTVPLQFVFPSANPGCFLNASLDLVMAPDIVFGGPGSYTWEGIDLTTTSALGAELFFTAATLDLTVLSDTTRTANAIKITTGIN
ncbi:hypothetical protein N8467_00210 [bacterium]|nr:hypothetical protein [bacterium]